MSRLSRLSHPLSERAERASLWCSTSAKPPCHYLGGGRPSRALDARGASARCLTPWQHSDESTGSVAQSAPLLPIALPAGLCVSALAPRVDHKRLKTRGLSTGSGEAGALMPNQEVSLDPRTDRTRASLRRRPGPERRCETRGAEKMGRRAALELVPRDISVPNSGSKNGKFWSQKFETTPINSGKMVRKSVLRWKHIGSADLWIAERFSNDSALRVVICRESNGAASQVICEEDNDDERTQ
jgi:hypothetical protein